MTQRLEVAVAQLRTDVTNEVDILRKIVETHDAKFNDYDGNFAKYDQQISVDWKQKVEEFADAQKPQAE